MSPVAMAPDAMSGHVHGHPEPEHSALVMGLLYGVVHIIGPDHLGTLMTLSSVASHTRAFKVGAAWGLGHSLGMVLIGVILISVHRLVRIDVALWEHYGNYFIGLSMMLCALYFILRESSFLEQQTDGTYVAKPCCHGPCDVKAEQTGPGRRSADRKDKRCGNQKRFCSSYCEQTEDEERFCPLADNRSSDGCNSGEHNPSEEAEESQPLLSGGREKQAAEEGPAAHQTWWQRAWAERDVKGAVLGMFQGACCPLGMVGMTFLANLPVTGVVIFLVVFMFVSAFGTASLAVAWAFLTARGLCGNISPRIMYRASCGFTLTLGVAWVVANFCGVLGRLDYAGAMHHHHTSAAQHGGEA